MSLGSLASNDDLSDAKTNQNRDSPANSASDGLSVFCREVRNLLRSKPNCSIPFSKFVPAYHNHYGRQCCVYQFGFTKLLELLESIPHVVQVLGDGSQRYITLTHREQIKRFASDLIKVVKAQPGKRLKLSQFATAYEQTLGGRKFRVQDYGTSNINVLLAEIWEGTINIMPIKRDLCEPPLEQGPLYVGAHSREEHQEAPDPRSSDAVGKPYITQDYPDAWFEIPKRERSEREIKRTRYFVWDVIELLSNLGPEHSVPFSKFIPSYHYYFNRQCKVSIFGFSKLIDLFESISPEVVHIVDQGPDEEKIIRLAPQHIPKPPPPPPPPSSSARTAAAHKCARTSASAAAATSSAQVQADQRKGPAAQANRCPTTTGEPEPTIDCGPTEKELMELEDELEAYEQLQAIQRKRSNRMVAMLDIFKYSVY